TAQYFYSHTQVMGSPLEFAVEQRRMVRGYLLFFLLYLVYKLALKFSQDLVASVLFFGFAALLPYLWASAMRFRLGATRWRGIRLAFTANWKEVYLASWPVFAIAAVWTAMFIAVGVLLPEPGKAFTQKPPVAQVQHVAAQAQPGADCGAGDQNAAPGSTCPKPAKSAGSARKSRDWPLKSGQDWSALLAPLALAAMLTLLLVIRLEFNYRRLLVARARIGGQAGRWKPVYRHFVRVWLAAIGILLLSLLGLVLLGATFILLAGASALLAKSSGAGNGAGIFVLIVMLFILIMSLLAILASLPARAYHEAGIFQLVWNNVGFGDVARTRTNLRSGAYMWLRLKNMLLTIVTLGFYRPFARVSEYAAKAGSVTIYVKGGTEQLAGELVKQQGAFGDAAADAFGLDLIG
ncbi:MAG: DUF898 domain-containing protein, partial [Burkholderiaceae bacterium]|nr:DUF898 domain-containing protein [Burkholderiaceae bacterium]